jgi:hypothetical protein
MKCWIYQEQISEVWLSDDIIFLKYLRPEKFGVIMGQGLAKNQH